MEVPIDLPRNTDAPFVIFVTSNRRTSSTVNSPSSLKAVTSHFNELMAETADQLRAVASIIDLRLSSHEPESESEEQAEVDEHSQRKNWLS